MATTNKSGTTNVKYVKDGKEQAQDVNYSVELGTDLEGTVGILKTKLSEEEAKADADGNAVKKLVDYVNQILEQNARQAARAAFLASIEGPDKQIAAMAKKLAAVKNISLEEAEKKIRAAMDAGVL
jgi:hypothetical protein